LKDLIRCEVWPKKKKKRGQMIGGNKRINPGMTEVLERIPKGVKTTRNEQRFEKKKGNQEEDFVIKGKFTPNRENEDIKKTAAGSRGAPGKKKE